MTANAETLATTGPIAVDTAGALAANAGPTPVPANLATAIAPPSKCPSGTAEYLGRCAAPTVALTVGPSRSETVVVLSIVDGAQVVIQRTTGAVVVSHGVGCLGMPLYVGRGIALVNAFGSAIIGGGASFSLPNGQVCPILGSEAAD